MSRFWRHFVTNGTTRGFLGIHIRSVRLPQSAAEHYGLDQRWGVTVLNVESDSPAEAACIEKDDVLLAIDGQPIVSVSELRRLLRKLPIGIPCSVEFLRGERKLERLIIPQGQVKRV